MLIFRLLPVLLLASILPTSAEAWLAHRSAVSPALSFTALSNGSTSSTTTGSGTYTVSAPSGLTAATYGGGCSGSATVSGFSAGGGTWSATFTTPASGCTGTLAVTGTGSNTASATSPSATFSGGSGDLAFTALHTYFMAASGCSDSNNGTSTGTPWCSTNHSVVCGDVIIAAAGAYNGDLATWGTVSNCPSSTGGIDGTGGIYAAVLLCGGADLNSCVTDCAVAECQPGHLGSGGRNAISAAMNVNSSFWSVQGWTVKGASSHRGLQVDACLTTSTIIHHVSFINNVVSNAATGYNTNDCGYTQDVPGNGVDYFAVIGSIAQNAAQDAICVAAIDAVGMANIDTNAGTHVIFAGNFSYANRVSCNSDGEGYMFDTLDAHGLLGLAAAFNNVGWLSERFGFQVFNQGLNQTFQQTAKVYNNTLYSNCAGQNSGNTFDCGEINIASSVGGTTVNETLSVQNNISLAAFVTGGGGTGEPVYGLMVGGVFSSLTIGGSGPQNVVKALATTCQFTCDSGSSPFNAQITPGSLAALGTNTYSNPTFTNATDLINNRSGTPNCTGFTNVAACMGYDAVTSTLTTPSVISDLTPTGTFSSKGYQLPSITCASNADYPAWLKGIVYLTASGSTITERAGLITKPCGT